MKRINLKLPEFGFVLGTRIALALGVGLLVSERIPEARRRQIGSALVALGVATTLPALMTVRRRLSSGPVAVIA